MRQVFLALILSLFICAKAGASEVRVGLGNFAPYFIAEDESGIFTEIIQAVFQEIPGYTPVYVHGLSNKRLWSEYSFRRLDVVANIIDYTEFDGCRSDPVFRFEDVAVTLKSRNIDIQNIQDLQGKRLVTYQGAKAFLGDEFANIVTASQHLEMWDQARQAKILFKGRVDVSIGDEYIFLNSLREFNDKRVSYEMFDFHHIFPRQFTRMGFRDELLCQKFNEGLKIIKDNGTYEKIYQTYLDRLHTRYDQ